MTIKDFIHNLVGYTLVQFNIDSFPGHFDTELYSVCRQSVIDNVEFDNYLNFSSVNEIYDYFPMIISDCKDHEELLEVHNNLIYLLDIVRMALTKYIKNMIYIDSDIKVLSKLNKNSYTDDFILFKQGTDFFFSKQFGKTQSLCLEYLNKDYKNDFDFYQTILSKDLEPKKCDFTEYYGLMVDYSRIVICLTTLAIDEAIEHYIENHSSENIIFILLNELKIYKYFYKHKRITFYKNKEDLNLYISEINIIHKPYIELLLNGNNLPQPKKKKLLKCLFNSNFEENQII